MKLLVVICCVFLLLGSISCSKSKQNTSDGWELIWEENFEGKSLNTDNWNIIKRNRADWGNTMSSDTRLREVKDGKLILWGIVNDDLQKDTSKFLTAGVDTKGKFAFQYGKIEVNAKLDNATGAWPAIWMLGDKPKYGGWPNNGEIDLMEHLNYEDQVYQTIHSYYTVKMGEKKNPVHYHVTKVNPNEFVRYGMEWYPDSIVYTINGEKTFTYPKILRDDHYQWPFDQPYYLMIDMQLGGSWVGEVDPNDLPVKMEVDWVKVYQKTD